MLDRYDSRKGRYVRYDYDPLGDRFSRGLSETPRSYQLERTETGHLYKRRTRTTEAKAHTAKELLEQLRREENRSQRDKGDEKNKADEEGKEALEGRVIYLHYRPFRFVDMTLHLLEVYNEPPGQAVRFTLTTQYKGRRVWLVCPHCARRIGTLYSVKNLYLAFWTWGCQKCLGLSYPSQFEHKNRYRDLQILEGRVRVGFIEVERAFEREMRRLNRFSARVRTLKEEVWHLLERFET